MTKLKKRNLVFLIIFAQTVLGVAAGFIALHLTTMDVVPENVYVEELHIGGLSRDKAYEKLKSHYEGLYEKGFIRIKFEGNKTFKINFNEIKASVDYESTINSVWSNGNGGNGNIFSRALWHFVPYKRKILPVIKVNKEMLKDKLKEISVFIDVEPRNANIFLQGNRVVKTAEVNGLRLNLENACAKIVNELKGALYKTIEFKLSNNYEIETVTPQVTLEDFDGIEEIISTYSTEIPYHYMKNSLRTAAHAINKVILPPADKIENNGTGEFSFNKCLNRKKPLEEELRGYSQVASTLYAAVLNAGIDINSIMRVANKKAVDYIEPGLDVRVDGDAVDFKFENTLGNKIMIFSHLEGNRIIVNLAGKAEKPDVKYELITEIVQRYSPMVINVENHDLNPGQRRLVSAGKEGVKINVYRITIENGIQTNKEFICTDTYEPITSIIEIGPDTEWGYKPSK
jgi:vancomycin resistance protein YoaR